MNLIRVMPAKGQDRFMPMSIFLAKLIGPVALAIGAGMVANARAYRAMAEEFLRSHALIYLSGVLSITGGLAIVLNHNVWTPDWRVIITVLGWLACLGGILRIVTPQHSERIGRSMLGNPSIITGAGAVVFALGITLCYFGYMR